jgi:uncharacterized protein (TIGR02246 family)
MKIRLVVALVGLTISFALPVFAQQKDAVDPQIVDQIDAIAQKYNQALINNDASAIAALYTEDAILVGESGPIYGRQAIEKWYADLFQKWRPKERLTTVDRNSPRFIGTAENVASNGDWTEIAPGPTGEPIQIKGYWSAIDIREGDGWKIRMLTWNMTPPPPPAAETK